MTDTRTRILDAALTVMSRHGLSRLALEDVAREAGTSRQTVYRHMHSREGLVAATIVREEQAFLERMSSAMNPEQPFEDALRSAILEALRAAREHPLLDRLMATEPEALLPFLTNGQGPVLSVAKEVVHDLLSRWVGHLDAAQLERVSEATTRLIVSYAISPPAEPSEELADGLAKMIAHGVAPGD
jgi:AcrR family transcriptional regulator